METEETVDRVSCRPEQDPRTGLRARLGGGASEEGTRSPEARKACKPKHRDEHPRTGVCV